MPNLATKVDINSIVEDFLYDDVSRMSSDQIHEWCNSAQASALMEAGVLTKPTFIRLSKEDDEKRRIKLICYKLAKNAKDPNYEKCMKYRALWKEYRQKIFDKYAAQATRLARIAQKEYIKKVRASATAEESKETENK